MEHKKVLIVDDAKLSRRMLTVIYDSQYEILEAEDGEVAIQLIDKFGDDIDLVLLDLHMPKRSGFDVLDHMRVHNYLDQMPVIVITSSEDEEDEVRAFNNGASEIVRKPFTPELVLRRSENLMKLYASKKSIARQLMISQEQLTGIQQKDALTGLLNMRTFFEASEKLLQESDSDTEEAYSFVYSNITNFHYYNVMYGAEEGDRILKVLAEKFSSVNKNLLCSRFGQDHFAVLTTDSSAKIEEKVRAIADDFEVVFGQLGMQFKAGVYHVPRNSQKVQRMCELAKLACDSIRNSMECYREYTEELQDKVEMGAYVIQHIDEALANHYVQVYYQPVVRTTTQKTCGMEALARWIDPQKGFLAPDVFIGTLENNHQISKLDLYIVQEVCQSMQRVRREGHALLPVSINISRMDFMECDVVGKVNEICEKFDIPHDLLNIEITETAFIDDTDLMKRELKRFRDNGYQVWMDDFGSGYSSLNVLKDYEFDEIKLDMRFLSSFDRKSKEIIIAIVQMVKKIGMEILAEGVETQEQYDFLKEIGCEKVQGYLIGRPCPEEVLLKSDRLRDDAVEVRGVK